MFRRYDLLTTLFTLVGLILSVAQYEKDAVSFCLHNIMINDGSIEHINAMESLRYLAWYNFYIRFIVLITSIISIICLVM